jgi:hypothetical protein
VVAAESALKFFRRLLIDIVAVVWMPAAAWTQAVPSTAPHSAGESFAWKAALLQSALFLGVEHGFRLTQGKTREELKGSFFGDYASSFRHIDGWSDGDSIFTSYFGHPMQGAVSGFIQIHNDPTGRTAEVGGSGSYWRSRLRATAWAAAYSTQFEIGPVSEATIGNVGKKPGTGGYVDFVVTPVGGLGWIVAEDALDRFVVRKREEATASMAWKRFYRVALNPTRAVANLLRMKAPWHRDTR